uniref:BPTI/Kunitz inhibitor domain-containing protein n=1 Tax=Varanus komodoensis TaxID=61221 RepID=A0A8D2IIW3_VARKO
MAELGPNGLLNSPPSLWAGKWGDDFANHLLTGKAHHGQGLSQSLFLLFCKRFGICVLLVFIFAPLVEIVSGVEFISINASNFLPCFKKTMPRKCRLPPRYGWCKESFQNFYYDFKSSMCKTFIYSGCRGNGNNFVTLLDCFLECGKFGKGLFFTLCKFGRRNKRCRPFTYGGCGGNANNFPSYHTCARENPWYVRFHLWTHKSTFKCCLSPSVLYIIFSFFFFSSSSPESDLATCEQPRDRGPCTESFPRFYYDAHSKNCSAFDFGSCNGNRNNFMTIEEKCCTRGELLRGKSTDPFKKIHQMSRYCLRDGIIPVERTFSGPFCI